MAFTTHTYDHDSSAESYGLEAAEILGLNPHAVFKTLVADTDIGLAVGLVPVAGHLDLKALAAAVGTKHAKMADPAVASRATGYVIGGISPIGQQKALPTVIDESALTFETIYVSGGRRGFDVGLSPHDLMAVTGAVAASIARR